ncbi:MAG: ABC transporter ATP-binding protein [Theionarchaea archaeon]|nr:ABC transporter ATP-binding protein [Theionarchaea archaeon]
MSVASIRDLSKSYGSVLAVDGLSVEIEEGAVMGLIGPNGAGKTTTIKVLLGLLRPDSGTVEVFGEDPWDNPRIRARVGTVHERSSFPQHQQVLGYLQGACSIYGVPESRAAEALGMVDLEDVPDRKVGELSAGMLQKFAIAHALVHEPEFIVADEPTSNLDPRARNELLDLIARLNREHGTTFLVSSHILPELSRICRSVAIISQGKLWAQGDVDELWSRFGAGVTRVSTDKPDLLAERVRELGYVVSADVDATGISIRESAGNDRDLYGDVLKLAREAGARITGIETGTSSLEELFRMATGDGDER